MKQQAEMLADQGHEVRVVTGLGDPPSEKISFALLPELHPRHETNLKVKRAVDHGQTDAHFQEFTGQLKTILEPHFKWADLVIDHGALTTHFNLSLTRAVHELATDHKIVAWAHDFTPTNKSYALPNPDHHPWSLMKTPAPGVHYIAVSKRRAEEIKSVMELDDDRIDIIFPGVDWNDCLGLDPLFLDRMDRWHPLQRDLILYYPTKLLQRKNIDLAFQMTAAVRESGMDALLIVSGAADPQEKENHPYQTYLESLPAQMQIEDHACFLSSVFQDPLVAWQQAFRIADVLLFPSGYEGFGLPVVESLFHKLPCWTSLEATALGLPHAHIIPVNTPEEASARAQGMNHDPVHRERREWMREQAPEILYEKHYLPLFEKLGYERRPLA